MQTNARKLFLIYHVFFMTTGVHYEKLEAHFRKYFIQITCHTERVSQKE